MYEAPPGAPGRYREARSKSEALWSELVYLFAYSAEASLVITVDVVVVVDAAVFEIVSVVFGCCCSCFAFAIVASCTCDVLLCFGLCVSRPSDDDHPSKRGQARCQLVF
jgi:hypothetical protein